MNAVNTLVLTVMVLLTFVVAATGAPASVSAQYLGNIGSDADERTGSLKEVIGSGPGTPPPPVEYSTIPFIILSIMGVAAGAIASAFFIKGRSGRHAAVENG